MDNCALKSVRLWRLRTISVLIGLDLDYHRSLQNTNNIKIYIKSSDSEELTDGGVYPCSDYLPLFTNIFIQILLSLLVTFNLLLPLERHLVGWSDFYHIL